MCVFVCVCEGERYNIIEGGRGREGGREGFQHHDELVNNYVNILYSVHVEFPPCIALIHCNVLGCEDVQHAPIDFSRVSDIVLCHVL